MSSHSHTHTPHIYPQTCSHTVTNTLTHTSIHTHSHTPHIYPQTCSHTVTYTLTHTYIHTHSHTHTLLHIWRGPRWLPGILGRGRQPNSILWQVRTFLLKALFDLWLKQNRTSFRHLGSTGFPKLHTLMGSKENFTRAWGSQEHLFRHLWRCWERLRARGEVGNREWDGWMASLTQGTWVWANFGWW